MIAWAHLRRPRKSHSNSQTAQERIGLLPVPAGDRALRGPRIKRRAAVSGHRQAVPNHALAMRFRVGAYTPASRGERAGPARAGKIAAASALGVGIAGSSDVDEESFVVLLAATAGGIGNSFRGVVHLRDGNNQESASRSFATSVIALGLASPSPLAILAIYWYKRQVKHWPIGHIPQMDDAAKAVSDTPARGQPTARQRFLVHIRATRDADSKADAAAILPAAPAQPFLPVKPVYTRPRETHRQRVIWYSLAVAGHSGAAFDAWSTKRAVTGGYGQRSNPFLRPFANSNAIYAATQVSPAIMDYLGKKDDGEPESLDQKDVVGAASRRREFFIRCRRA